MAVALQPHRRIDRPGFPGPSPCTRRPSIDRRARPPDLSEQRLAELSRSRGSLRRVLAGLALRFVAPRRWEPLGYVRAADYARERLGLSARSLHDWARVGRALLELPRLEAALVSGALPWSKVRLLARFATPADEAPWIARAQRCTVRELEHEVRAVDHGSREATEPTCDDDGGTPEPTEAVQLRVDSALYFKWQHARTWASKVAGERIPPGTALEMITAEALSALPTASLVDQPDDAPAVANVCAQHVATAVQVDEDEARPGSGVADVCTHHGATTEPPVLVGPPLEPAELPTFLQTLLEGLDDADAFELDARLRRAVRLEQRLDAEIVVLLRAGLPTSAARERLGMSPRKARALLRLERVGAACPELRAGWRSGALSWVQAQILAPLLLASAAGGWGAAWVAFAGRVTVRRLDEVVDRALTLSEADPACWDALRGDPEGVAVDCATGSAQKGEETGGARQTCARPTAVLAGIRLRVMAPRDVARLFRSVLCSLRRATEARTGRLPGEDEAFEAMIDHALGCWGVGAARTPRRFAVFARDGWRCTVPGCSSHRNLHAHHVRFRSAGGSDEPANLVTLCAAHHHRGVHAGRVRVGGEAPDGLWFELGCRAGRAPLVRYRSGDRVA